MCGGGIECIWHETIHRSQFYWVKKETLRIFSFLELELK